MHNKLSSFHTFNSDPEGLPPMSVRLGPNTPIGHHCPIHCSRMEDTRAERIADAKEMQHAVLLGTILAGILLPVVMHWPN